MKKNFNFKDISVHELPEQSPGFLLWQVSTLWRRAIESALKTFDLTHPQFVILAVLGWLTRNGDRVNQAAIGKLAALDPNTVSQIIKGLEKRGIIAREAGEDGRVKNPILTMEGSELLKGALPAVEKMDGLFFQSLQQREIKDMLVIFLKLCKR